MGELGKEGLWEGLGLFEELIKEGLTMKEQEQTRSVPRDDGNGNLTAVHGDESRHWYWRPETSMASIHDLLHPSVMLYYLHCKD